uniref:C2H2-type domain-containing protein n=1 Tax=Ditylenchus dipsaci TaxID=166011 RepID=A0A915E5X2_9BILA
MSSEEKSICVICEKKYGNLIMLKHIAAHLAYYPHFCVDCEFKSYEVHCLVEHELATGHNIKQNVHNRYMEKICSMVYKDCLIATKYGLEAVFEQITGGKDRAVVTQTTPVSAIKKVVRPLAVTSDSSSDSDDDVQLLPRPKMSSAAKTPVQQNKQISAVSVEKTPVQQNKQITAVPVEKTPVQQNKQIPAVPVEKTPVQQYKQSPSVSVQKTPEVTRSKAVAKKDSSSSTDSERRSVFTEMEMAELDRQINRGYLTQRCNQCKKDVTNNYRSHKEHVLRDHLSMQTNESKEEFIARFVKFCFPMAVAVNDLQCGICGIEAKPGGRKTHINREHLFFYLECPVKSCIFNCLCESSVITHLKKDHRTTVQELVGEEKAAFEKERIAYNAKMQPYLSRCFPCTASSKGADKLEKEALAEIQRELFSQFANGNGTRGIISPRSASNVAVEPIAPQRSLEDGGRKVSFIQTEASHISQDRGSCFEKHRADTHVLGSDKNRQPRSNRSKTPQSALCPKNNDRNSGYDGTSSSSRQDRRSSHNRGHRGEISPLRTATKRNSADGLILSVESARSQHLGTEKIQSGIEDKARQSGNRDYRTGASSPKRSRCGSSNREPVVTPLNKVMSGRASIQSKHGQQINSSSPGVYNSQFIVGGHGTASTTHDFSVPPPFFFNPPSAVTYGNVPMPTGVIANEDVKFEVPQRLKSPCRGGTIEGLIKEENI